MLKRKENSNELKQLFSQRPRKVDSLEQEASATILSM
jgi:hypothetical protein